MAPVHCPRPVTLPGHVLIAKARTRWCRTVTISKRPGLDALACQILETARPQAQDPAGPRSTFTLIVRTLTGDADFHERLTRALVMRARARRWPAEEVRLLVARHAEDYAHGWTALRAGHGWGAPRRWGDCLMEAWNREVADLTAKLDELAVCRPDKRDVMEAYLVHHEAVLRDELCTFLARIDSVR